jgi:hypothetical protein
MTKILWALAYVIAPLLVALSAFDSALAFSKGSTGFGIFGLFLAFMWIGLRFTYLHYYKKRKELE